MPRAFACCAAVDPASSDQPEWYQLVLKLTPQALEVSGDSSEVSGLQRWHQGSHMHRVVSQADRQQHLCAVLAAASHVC